MKKQTKDFLIIGFALFAMFFGAGNLIFPSYLGNAVGSEYITAMIGFIITGVGLPLLAIIAFSKNDGTLETISSKMGPKFAIILTSLLFLAIGPMLGIPRTAATTHELAISPLLPWLSPLTSMVIYFAINLFFVLKRSSVIDTIGKYLTPLLIIILTYIVIRGIISPIGEITSTSYENVLSSSLIEGYQTMDAIAALLFATVITSSIKSKGYKKHEILPMTVKASIIAAIGLAFVYGGLTILGAQTTTIAPDDVNKTALLLLISQKILGNVGSSLIGIAMSLACLTTSIGLLTAGSEFFEKISNGKLKYEFNAIAISLVSIVIGSLGVDKIVVISGPILNILYPVSITLVVTTLLSSVLKNNKAIQLGVYTSLIMGILGEIKILNLNAIPLASLGFAWLIPTIIAILVGYIIFRDNEESEFNLG